MYLFQDFIYLFHLLEVDIEDEGDADEISVLIIVIIVVCGVLVMILVGSLMIIYYYYYYMIIILIIHKLLGMWFLHLAKWAPYEA